jgi:hypothetical protein
VGEPGRHIGISQPRVPARSDRSAVRLLGGLNLRRRGDRVGGDGGLVEAALVVGDEASARRPRAEYVPRSWHT